MEHHIHWVVQPKLGLLHQQLRESPPQASSEGRDEEEVEAEKVELRSFVREHDEASGDHQHYTHERP